MLPHFALWISFGDEMPTKTYKNIPLYLPETPEYELWLICVPCDDHWANEVRESVRQMTKGRYWDRNTGSIKDAQRIAREVYNSMTCLSGLESALNAIASAIDRVNAVTNIDVNCCEQLTRPIPLDPLPGPVPPAGTQTPPPAYPTPQAYSDELCRFANGMHWIVRKFLDWLEGASIFAAIAAILIAAVGVLFPEPATTVIGGVTIATIVGILMFTEGGLAAVGAWASEALDYWDANQQDLTCYVYNIVGNTNDWKNQVVNHFIQVIESFPINVPGRFVINRVFAWLSPFLEWAAGDLYEFGQNMEAHESPIDCTNCANNLWVWDFEDLTLGAWENHGVNLANQNGSLYVRPDSQSGFKWFDMSANRAATYFGMPQGAYQASQFTFSFYINDIGSEVVDCLMQVQVYFNDDTTAYLWNSNTDLHPHGEWVTISVPHPSGILRNVNPCWYFYHNRQGTQWPNGSYILYDNIIVENI